MDQLNSYIQNSAAELVSDMIPGLREADAAFRECTVDELQAGLGLAFGHLHQYVGDRSAVHLEHAFSAFQSLWPRDRFYQSSIVRPVFAFYDLLSIRARERYADADDFMDDLRVFCAGMREALCLFADRFQSRNGEKRVGAAPAGSIESGGSVERHERTSGAPGQVGLLDRLDAIRPVGRDTELRTLWSRLRAIANGERNDHQIVGVKGPAGYGKATLISSFIDRVEHHIGQPPNTIRARAPRLFDLPSWPFALLLRDAFRAPPGIPGNADRIRSMLETLAAWREESSSNDAARLRGAAPYLLRLLGEEREPDEASALTQRTVGIRLRHALVTLIEVLALRARAETGAPLFIVIEDVGEMDGPSWSFLRHLLEHVSAEAPLMVLLTYDVRSMIPADVNSLSGFSEVNLAQFDMQQGDHLIDTLLSPNRLESQTRIRLNVGSQGSPLLLCESIRQLVADGILGVEGGRWVEITPLPEGVVGDLPAIVARRQQRLEATAAEVLEVVVVVEDTTGGTVLSEVASRRAIGRDELMVGLETLRRVGLIEVIVDEGGISARTRHPLIRDEIYRQMGQDRRRAIHEDAGEVFLKLTGAQAFPSLAASHLALAGWPTRALQGLVEGIDRCWRMNSLDGGLELCSQALGLLKGLNKDDHDRFYYQILLRRERIYGRLGHRALQESDQAQLKKLAITEGTEEERNKLQIRSAMYAVEFGDPTAVEFLTKRSSKHGASEVSGARSRLALALYAWQQGNRIEGRAHLEAAMVSMDSLPQPLQARLLYTVGLFDGGEGRLQEALHNLFEAWRLQRSMADVYGEALVVQGLGGVFWAGGRLLDGQRLLRRADRLLARTEEHRARARIRLSLGDLHAQIGNFDEAEGLYADVIRSVDKNRDRLIHAAAVIGQGLIMVNRGRFDDAMSILAQCLKDLGRKAVREPIYVDALVALAMNFAMFARGEKLVVGGLRYAGEAADRAGEIGHARGLVRALVVQVRGLIVLGRQADAVVHMGKLDQAFSSSISDEPRMERLRTEVELARYHVLKATDPKAAEAALKLAWGELQAQLTGLRGSGYERGFLTNIFQNREIVMAVGEEPASD